MKFDSIPPRRLRYRKHHALFLGLFILAVMIDLAFWAYRIHLYSFENLLAEFTSEFVISITSACFILLFYFLWLKPRFHGYVQVYPDHLLLSAGNKEEKIHFKDLSSVKIIGLSLFSIKTINGKRYFFNSSYERVDYIWVGIHKMRPDLFEPEIFESHRLRLIQFDHHQKRKEWFFKHKLLDFVNWIVMPVFFLLFSFVIQSKSIIIQHPTLYFFRLALMALFVLLITAFFYSLLLKKYVFDKNIISQSETSDNRARDIDFEARILQKTKAFHLISATFLLAMLVKLDLNFISVTRTKDGLVSWNIKKGSVLFVDTRFNCFDCNYKLKDGDIVAFGRGDFGQILAKEGDKIGQFLHDPSGRSIASENIQEVPPRHVAIKVQGGKEILFVEIESLLGKIHN